MFLRISQFYKIEDIYSMKESVFIEDKEKDYQATTSFRKPVFVVLTISVILILMLNLVNTILFS